MWWGAVQKPLQQDTHIAQLQGRLAADRSQPPSLRTALCQRLCPLPEGITPAVTGQCGVEHQPLDTIMTSLKGHTSSRASRGII